MSLSSNQPFQAISLFKQSTFQAIGPFKAFTPKVLLLNLKISNIKILTLPTFPDRHRSGGVPRPDAA